MSNQFTAEIYIALCVETKKVYVGSARYAKVRIRDHKRELNSGSHNNSYLQRAWNKYGEDGFEWHIIDNCPLDERWQREQWWIEKLFACDSNRGFNVMHSAVALKPSPIMSKLLKEYWAKRWSDEEYSKLRTEQLREIVNRPDVKVKMSKSKLENWADPDYRKRQIAAQKAGASLMIKRKENSERIKALWKNPEYRARQTAERSKRFKDPEFRKKLSIAALNRKRKQSHNEIV